MENEFSPNIPIYIPVMEYIKQEIVTGRLAPGDKIPAVRELASELQVNPNTIQRTFQEPEREGIVHLINHTQAVSLLPLYGCILPHQYKFLKMYPEFELQLNLK